MKAARISNFNSRMQIRPVYKTLLSKPYASLKTERVIHKKASPVEHFVQLNKAEAKNF